MLSPSFLLEQDIHRRKYYPYIYYCTDCRRSYLEKELQEKCRFCQGKIELTQGGKKYVYFCKNCDKRIQDDEPKMACPTCRNHVQTLFRWDMLDRREKRRIMIARFLKSFSRGRRKKTKAIKIEKKVEKFVARPIAIPHMAINEKIKGEELPTDEIGRN